jgi:hypothetical protein
MRLFGRYFKWPTVFFAAYNEENEKKNTMKQIPQLLLLAVSLI